MSLYQQLIKTYHQVNIFHYTSIIELNAGTLQSADVGFHLNGSR